MIRQLLEALLLVKRNRVVNFAAYAMRGKVALQGIAPPLTYNPKRELIPYVPSVSPGQWQNYPGRRGNIRSPGSDDAR